MRKVSYHVRKLLERNYSLIRISISSSDGMTLTGWSAYRGTIQVIPPHSSLITRNILPHSGTSTYHTTKHIICHHYPKRRLYYGLKRVHNYRFTNITYGITFGVRLFVKGKLNDTVCYYKVIFVRKYDTIISWKLMNRRPCEGFKLLHLSGQRIPALILQLLPDKHRKTRLTST